MEKWVELPNVDTIPADMLADYHTLYKSPLFQELVLRGAEYGLSDNVLYMAERMDAIAEPSYLPTVPDLMNMRVVTTCVNEVVFDYEDLNFRMVDVGGQRNERRKWLHCLADDHEVLTRNGFLPMHHVRRMWSELQLAGYDVATDSVCFERPTDFVFREAEPNQLQDMVLFEDGHLSLLVTSDHDMWVQRHGQVYFAKVRAGKCLAGSPVSLRTCVGNGLGEGSQRVIASLCDSLGVLSGDALESVMWLFGRWLIDGRKVRDDHLLAWRDSADLWPHLAACDVSGFLSGDSVCVACPRWLTWFSGSLPLEALSGALLRTVIEGASVSGKQLCICTSVAVRDEVMTLCFYAG